MRRLILLLSVLLALVLAPAAQAGWFVADSVDGPGEIDALGDVDIARDGMGGVVYVKREGGVPQVFLSRLVGGAFQAPVRLSSGAAVSEAAVSAVDGGRLLVAWIAGGEVVGTVIASRSAVPTQPVVLGGAGGASGLGVDLAINGNGYAIWSEPGGGGADVRAAFVAGSAWAPLGAPLDIDPASSAGSGSSRPRIAVSAEGNGVATWAEAGADGRNHVHARRLFGTTLSSYPQDLTLAAFENQAAGNADSPDVDVEDDGAFAWAVFRQDVGGRSRSIARRLRGTQFDEPYAIDAGVTSFAPRIDFSARGLGGAVAGTANNATFSAYLDKFDAFRTAVRIDQTPSGSQPSPVIAASELGEVYAAWRTGGADGSGAVHVRRKPGEGAFEPEFAASNPAFGSVPPGQVAIGADRLGNTAVAMLQGAPGASRLTVAVWDRPPSRPGTRDYTVPRPRGAAFKWTPGTERWGAQTFTLYVDGRRMGTTMRTQLRPRRALRPGRHRYYVTATDRRGQVARSRTRSFRVARR